MTSHVRLPPEAQEFTCTFYEDSEAEDIFSSRYVPENHTVQLDLLMKGEPEVRSIKMRETTFRSIMKELRIDPYNDPSHAAFLVAWHLLGKEGWQQRLAALICEGAIIGD